MSAITNAINAQLSTGPTSLEGKQRVRFNALKTGLFARTVVQPDEEQPAYDALGAHIDARWQPRTDDERELVLTIQNSTWRLNRAVQLEFSLYAIGAQQHLEAIDKQFGEQTPAARRSLAAAAAYLATPRAFDQISRQEGRLQRTLDRAKREILILVTMRANMADPNVTPRPHPVSTPVVEPAPPPLAPEPLPQSGFVPSKFPRSMPTFSGPNKNDDRRRWLRKNELKNLA